MQKNFLVDQKEGPYYTIQQAIDAAGPNSIIKVAKGHYKENLRITVPNIKIEGKDMTPEVFVIGYRGPAVLIKLNPGESCHIQNIKFVHKGGGEYKICKELRAHPTLNHLSNAFHDMIPKQKSQLFTNYTNNSIESCYETFNSIDFCKRMDSMIFVKSGGLILRNCYMSMSY